MCQCDSFEGLKDTTNMNLDAIMSVITALLIEFKEDITREWLKDTPKRVAKAYTRILWGYWRSLKNEITVFENSHGYEDIIYSWKISFFSTCEHHLLPFFGTAHVWYVPNKKIIGLSKIARAIDIFSRRLQDQERITMQVANELFDLLEPLGVAVFLEGQHFCNMARWVEQVNSNMKTICFKWVFKNDKSLCDRFMSMVNN
jgi:GTP cyclohydrolase I